MATRQVPSCSTLFSTSSAHRRHLTEWPDEDHRTRIVFIARCIRFEGLLTSLEAFRCIVGARPRLLEANALV
jgi:hypothetical protein